MAGDDVLIAYGMNGVPLPQAHGFPVRMIVPGLYGMKSVQWLTEIEIVSHDFKGLLPAQGVDGRGDSQDDLAHRCAKDHNVGRWRYPRLSQ